LPGKKCGQAVYRKKHGKVTHSQRAFNEEIKKLEGH